MKKKWFLIIPIFLLFAFVFWLGRISNNPVQANNAPDSSPKIEKQTMLKKTFSFSVPGTQENALKNIDFIIDSATLQKQIIINGQLATAIHGRIFLVVNIKISNPNQQDIAINTRDYIRLTTNHTKEFFAPDIHNDPVQVQAISTKITRVGFPINENDSHLVLHVGEINSDKTTIPLFATK